MASVITYLNPASLGDIAESLKQAIPHLNKYFIEPVEAPPQEVKPEEEKMEPVKISVQEEPEEDKAKHAEAIKMAERKNLDTDKNVANTDWTNIKTFVDTRVQNVNDAVALDYQLQEYLPVQKNPDLKAGLNQVLKKLPQEQALSAEQYAQFADEAIKRSSAIFQQLINTAYNSIDEKRSRLIMFSKLLAYPEGKIYIKIAPRNIYDTLPGLLPEDKYASKEEYQNVRRNILREMANLLSVEVHATVTYGTPSYGPVEELTFEPANEFHTILTDQVTTPSMETTKQQTENACECVIASSRTIPTFWSTNEKQANVVYGHSTFVKIAKQMLARDDFDSMQHVALACPVVALAGDIPYDKERCVSTKFDITSPHYCTVDSDSVLTTAKGFKQQKLTDMYKAFKAKEISSEIKADAFETGLVASDVKEDVNADMYNFMKTVLNQGSFMKLCAGQQITTLTTNPAKYYFAGNSSKVVLPKVTFTFRSLTECFVYGVGNICPRLEPLRNGACQSLLNGICYTRVPGERKDTKNLERFPMRIVMPGRIFSHLLLKVDNCDGQTAIGFMRGNEIIARVNLFSGEIMKSDTGKDLQVAHFCPCNIRAGDQILLHYFTRGDTKVSQFLLIKRVRNATALDVGYLEVPQDQCHLVLWTLGERDSYAIVKSRLNMISPKDAQNMLKK